MPGRSRGGIAAPIVGRNPGLPSPLNQGSSPMGGWRRPEGNAPIVPQPDGGARTTTTTATQQQQPAPFTPTPEYSNVGAWNQWGQVAPQTDNSYIDGVFGETFNTITGGAADFRATYEQIYTNKYGADAVARAKQSGMDPATFFALAPAAQQIAVQWGTNLSNAQQIRADQQTAYDSHAAQVGQTNNLIDQFGNLQEMQYSNLGNQYASGAGQASARYDLGMQQLKDGLNIDMGMLGEQRYRAVDLGAADNAALLNYYNQMYGITDAQRGIRGTQFTDQQNYLNQQVGLLNQAQDNAYNRFNTNDAYMGQQAQDLMAQYGFNQRNRDQEMDSAFSQRGTQRRGAASDAAARGAFGSAGFGDNISDIQGQYDQSVARTQLGFDQANQQFDEQGRAIGNNRDNLRFGYNDTVIGFDRDKIGIANAHNQNNTGYASDLQQFAATYAGLDKSIQQTKNAQAGFASLAREYGMKEADIKNQFKNASTALGLDYNDTMQQLDQMMSSGNANLYAQAMQFMQQMMAYQ